MLYDRVENRQEYHDVVAQSLSSIIRLLTSKEKGSTDQAKTLIKFNIRQAYTINRLDEDENKLQVLDRLRDMQKKDKNADVDAVIKEELEDMGLDDLDVDELLTKMFAYQTLAGIKPVQTFRRQAKVFAVARGQFQR